MRPPNVTSDSRIIEMDGTLGIYNHNTATEAVDIWVLQDYKCHVWDLKYKI